MAKTNDDDKVKKRKRKSPRDQGPSPDKRAQPDYPQGYDLERRYEDAYLRNKENWDNPNSATSMNSPVWNDEDNWDPPGPLAGKDPKALTRPDSAIRAQINDRLALKAIFDTKDIEVIVENHKVTLNGVVHSKNHKRLVEEIANSVSGVEAVQNNLTVP